MADPGRGQGLGGIRRYLNRWDGKITIRSGTARIAIVPPWDDDVPLQDGLSFFPGAAQTRFDASMSRTFQIGVIGAMVLGGIMLLTFGAVKYL